MYTVYLNIMYIFYQIFGAILINLHQSIGLLSDQKAVLPTRTRG